LFHCHVAFCHFRLEAFGQIILRFGKTGLLLIERVFQTGHFMVSPREFAFEVGCPLFGRGEIGDELLPIASGTFQSREVVILRIELSL
jgi:hypothetical protein